MRRLRHFFGLVGFVVTFGVANLAAESIVTDLESSDDATRRSAWERAHELEASSIGHVFELLESKRSEVRLAASRALDRLAHDGARPDGDAARRSRITEAIAAVIVDAKTTVGAKRKAVELLGSTGDETSALALGSALAQTELRDDARRALERIPGGLATTLLASVLRRLSGEFAVDVARSLGARRDRRALETLMAIAKDPKRERKLRAACAIASCRTGRADAAPVAFDVLDALRPEEPVELTDALLDLAEALAATNPDATQVICREVRRHSQHATQRYAAIRINSIPAAIEDVDFLVSSLADSSDRVREFCVRILAEIDDSTIDARLREQYDVVDGSIKGGLLRVLAARKADGVTLLIEDASRSKDLDLQIDALALSGDIDDPIFEARLIAAARGAAKGGVSPRVRDVALSSLLRRADARLATNHKAAAKMYSTVLRLGTKRSQTTRALLGLAKTGSSSAPAAIEKAQKAESLREHVVIARIAYARAIGKKEKKEAVRQLQLALKSEAPLSVLQSAAKALIDLGEDPTFFQSTQGFISAWWIVGPFPNPDAKDLTTGFFPEKNIDLENVQTQEIDGRVRRFQWRKIASTDPSGQVDVKPHFRRTENVCMYAYAEITTKLRRRVVLKMGSDDSIVVWINSKKVHERSASRPVRVDEDSTHADLVAGKNKILIKLTQSSGGWGFAFRICGPFGRPLDLTRLNES